MKTLYLTALGPAPTLEAELVKIQRRLLEAAGLASALALPPALPLAFSFEAPEERCLEALRNEGLPSLSFGSIAARDGVFHLAVLPETYPPEAARRLGGSDPAAELFPCPAGFFLAAEEKKGPNLGAVPDWKTGLPPARLRVARLLVYKITIHREEAWWKALELEVEYEAWLKRRSGS